MDHSQYAPTPLRFRELDSLRGLAAITVVFHHSDGTSDEIETHHTLSEEHIDWFRAGSALNLLRRRGAPGS